MVVVISIIGILGFYIWWLNNRIINKKYELIDKTVVGKVKICYFSDLHQKRFGRDNSYLIRLIKDENPDYVLIGGDLLITYPAAYNGVRNRYNWLEEICNLIARLSELCPVYYVDGNHEQNLKTALNYAYLSIYEKYIQSIQNSGAVIINNGYVELKNNIVLYGYIQPYEFYKKRSDATLDINHIKSELGHLQKSKYNVLLTHDPKSFDVYSAWGANLILCGHTHGGMIRIRNKGLVSPSYKMFPQYCYGMYHKLSSHMIVTAGLNMHTIPIRWFNPAEIVTIKISEESIC